jgi:hypothetical protein
MKSASQLLAVSLVICAFSSCGPEPPEVQFVRDKIPIEIQRGKPLPIKIPSLSGNGANDVGIRCSPEVWNVLTNGARVMEVRLLSSSDPNTAIGGIDPGTGGTFLGYIPNVHFLFHISGERHGKALVEINFPTAPLEKTRAEIIVGKTPIDTKPLVSR